MNEHKTYDDTTKDTHKVDMMQEAADLLPEDGRLNKALRYPGSMSLRQFVKTADSCGVDVIMRVREDGTEVALPSMNKLGMKRRDLPLDSPLVGMDEMEAREWVEGRTLTEIADALGLTIYGVQARFRTGYILPGVGKNDSIPPLRIKCTNRTAKLYKEPPRDSPLFGMPEEQARQWAGDHTLSELAEALGMTRAGAAVRLKKGYVIESNEAQKDAVDVAPLACRSAKRSRRPLPEDSPLQGMTEEQAREWATQHTIFEIADALGVRCATARERLLSGSILPRTSSEVDGKPIIAAKQVVYRPRKPVPAGSPLQGMTEEQAQEWAAQHTIYELADALGVAYGTARNRLLSGCVLSRRPGMKDDEAIKPLRHRRDHLRKPLPEDSPLQGMSEQQAREWATKHSIYEIARALGVSYGTARYRLLAGWVLTRGTGLGSGKPVEARRHNGGHPRKPLPVGSPFEGMTEEQAQQWARQHTLHELADALGLTTGAARERVLSGSILSMPADMTTLN